MDNQALKKYKELLLKTFKEFDEFCTKNDLNYYACGGTAIGTLRHKGIVPWDDDIDVFMPRNDYNKFLLLKNKLCGTHYTILSLGDSNYVWPFAKFVDTNTTLVESITYECVLGVFIDIFPLDEVGDDVNRITEDGIKYHMYLSRYQNCLKKKNIVKTLLSNVKHCNYKQFFDNLYVFFIGRHSSRFCQNRLNDFFRFRDKLVKKKGDNYYVYHNSYGITRELQKKEWYNSYQYLPFENYKMRVQNGYNEYLTKAFGNYMTPPPIEKQVSHHDHFYLNLNEGLSFDQVKERIKRGEHLVY